MNERYIYIYLEREIKKEKVREKERGRLKTWVLSRENMNTIEKI